MKLVSILALLVVTLTMTNTTYTKQEPGRVWNILALDGGGIRGLITAKVV